MKGEDMCDRLCMLVLLLLCADITMLCAQAPASAPAVGESRLSGVVLNTTAIIEDNYGLIDFDDVDSRDQLRSEISKKMILLANNFVAYIKSGAWRKELEKLVGPQAVAEMPSTIVGWLENDLEEIDFDGTWDTQDVERLDKIRSAMAIKGLIDFGVPGKLRLDEEAGEQGQGALEKYLWDSPAGADPAFLSRVKAYEDAYLRLNVIRIEGTDGKPHTPVDVNALVTDFIDDLFNNDPDLANPPSATDISVFVNKIDQYFVDPTVDGWKVQPNWWNLPPPLSSGALVSEASQYNTVSGAQLLGYKMNKIDPANAGPDEIIEALTTARAYYLTYEGRVFKYAESVTGTWSIGDREMVFTESVVPSPEESAEVKILTRIYLDDDKLDVLHDDHAPKLAALGDVLPDMKISDELILLLKLIQAFHEPASNLPATEAAFDGTHTGVSSGGFSGRGPTLGTAF